jgi:hypothetical protein
MNLATFATALTDRGLHLLPGSHAVPVDLLVRLPDGTLAHFTARGTTLRLRRYRSDALVSIVIAPECGCGDHHPRSGPDRLVLGAHAVPVAEEVIDGRSEFGWTAHEAGSLRLAEASGYFFRLLAALTEIPAEPRTDVPTHAPRRTLVGVA